MDKSGIKGSPSSPAAGAARSSRLAYWIALFAAGVFAAVSIPESFAHGRRVVIGMIVTLVGAFVSIVVLHCLNRFIKEAFSIPFVLYLIHVSASGFTGNYWDFFPLCLAICCLGALFFNSRKLLWYIIVSNIISIILLVLNIPMTKLENGVRVQIVANEVMLNWFISCFGSIFVYIVVVFASGRGTSAVKAQNSFSSLLASTPNRVVLMDSLNRATYFSSNFAAMMHLTTPDMAIGRPVLDLVKDINLKMVIYQMLIQDGVYEGTAEIVLKGRQCFFNVITTGFSGETSGRLINIIDITPVMKAKLEAESASRSKSQFLATMSHEIRTPLNAIIGLSEIELQKKLPMETRQDLEKIHNSGASLLAIINDILDISKIEAGSFELVSTDYDVPSLVNDTVHLNIVRIGSKRIIFKLEIDESIPTRLLGDELRVKQVLNNLLSNAFKYTEEGMVVFKIEWERQGEKALLTFTVRDTGRGMRKEDIPRLFSEYSQLDAKANRYIEGTGLGLSITKNLVTLMHGLINVESEYGKGSVFTVRLPQLIVNETPIGEVTARNLEQFRFKEIHPLRGLRLIRNYMPYGKVLVVDDVETNLDVAKGLMLPYGLSIDFASSGVDAIKKIRAAGENAGSSRYDLVLMDHMMPGMDGVEAVRIIRSEIDSDYARTVPVIALTANALAGNEEMFLTHGFNAYISKPIDVMQLDVALNTWVRNKQSKETLLQAEMEKSILARESVQADLGILNSLSVNGIDLAKGRERYNSEAAYLEILRSYSLHTPVLLEKLRNCTPETLAEYAITVHGLKGSSYGICADEVGKRAGELENAAKAGYYEQVQTDTARFIEMVESLLAELGEALKKAVSAKAEKQKSAAPDSAALAKLLDAVKRYKATLMEEIIAELESYEYESGGELVQWLREQMDNLEYDAIRRRLEMPDPYGYNE
ncbi:MAG: response regulator [Treponema sp.]|jgi:signal transduction histidine kinase/CheY-like chemotaxis protein|nr:response regulator [Treponema sp.]